MTTDAQTAPLLAAGRRQARQRDQVLEQVLPLVSIATHKPYWSRIDPWWDGWLWDNLPIVTPHFEAVERPDPETGALRRTRETQYASPTGDGLRAWAATMDRPVVHRTLAALDGMHFMSAEQLCTWAHFGPGSTTRYLTPLFELGLTVQGHYAEEKLVPGKLAWLYKINTDAGPVGKKTLVHRWIKETDAKIVESIFGPDPRPHPGRGVPHARHDFVTTEAVLRLMETGCDRWAWVGPEWAATPRAVLGDTEAPDSFRGDAVLCRQDGVRIVLEVIGSQNRNHVRKRMNAWASVMASRPFHETGVVIVFLNASRRDHGRFASRLRSIHSTVISQGALRHTDGSPATWLEVTRARAGVHLAAWEDWFPARSSITEHGSAVGTAFTPDGERWLTTRAGNTTDMTWPSLATAHMLTPPVATLTPEWLGNLPLTVPKLRR